MTAKVVDASAFAAVAFLEKDFAAIQGALRGCTLHAPTLLRFEMANICVKKIRSGLGDMILSQYSAYFAVPLIVHDVDHTAVIGLAGKLNLTAYDASYLWLALNLNCELITRDEKLAKAFAKMGRQR